MSLFSFFPDYATTLAANILAEHPTCSPSVKMLIKKMLRGAFTIGDTLYKIEEQDDERVVVYWLDGNERMREWRALYHCGDDDILFLLGDFYVAVRLER